ncbi:MAG: hypothetical protein CMJ80_08535 [Planctomycetaceae bacterium]|nr:hypothetical protein [Planctomycetaceae bacterium]
MKMTIPLPTSESVRWLGWRFLVMRPCDAGDFRQLVIWTIDRWSLQRRLRVFLGFVCFRFLLGF